jgi:hypothetical protein
LIVSSYAWEHYGVKWVQLDAPRHFSLHPVESIRLLAKKAGLKVVNITHNSTSFQFWGSEQYERDIPLYDKRSYSVAPDGSLFSKKNIFPLMKNEQRNLMNPTGEIRLFSY